MIFSKTWKKVLRKQKTQTRRLVKEGDTYSRKHPGSWQYPIEKVHRGGRLLWEVGRTYAVQPDRGEEAIGTIQVTEIRRERLQDISREDAFAEGIGVPDYDDEISGSCLGGIAGGCGACENCEPVWWFFKLWDSIHKKPGTRVDDNPEVWVLTFICLNR